MCVSWTSIRLSFREIKWMKKTTKLIISTVTYQVRFKESFIFHIINQFLHCVVSLLRNNYQYSVLTKEHFLLNDQKCRAYVKLCSLSPVMMTSQNEWKILQWNAHRLKNKHTHTKPSPFEIINQTILLEVCKHEVKYEVGVNWFRASTVWCSAEKWSFQN